MHEAIRPKIETGFITSQRSVQRAYHTRAGWEIHPLVILVYLTNSDASESTSNCSTSGRDDLISFIASASYDAVNSLSLG